MTNKMKKIFLVINNFKGTFTSSWNFPSWAVQKVWQWDTLTKWWMLSVYLALMIVAGVMRFWDLGSRAMHHDESLHALYSWYLYMGGGYRHDPMMHGPFQIEATTVAFFIFGDSDFVARLVYGLAGTVLVLLPFFFRSRLGDLGAVLVSVMLTISPSMLYFSRFARNDIIVVIWTLGLVICMWRYLDEGRNRYLYIGSVLLALVFATKETAYLVTATLGFYLFLVVAIQSWPDIKKDVSIGRISPPVAITRVFVGVIKQIRTLRLPQVSRPGGFLILLFTLSLPLGSALVSVFQDTWLLGWSNLVLAYRVGGAGPIGMPSGGGQVIAVLVVLGAIWISASVGFNWHGWVWMRCAAAFSIVWVILYSTFFTNISGLGTGVWQSLGYWLVQQGVARGSQPLYYYLVITPLYEFLPMLIAIVGGVYYVRRKDHFGMFLAFWAVTTFLVYTVASEKMPWLLVNITLPLIVLSGKFLGELIGVIHWRKLVSVGGLFSLLYLPLALILLWRLMFLDFNEWDALNILKGLAHIIVLVTMGIVGIGLARKLNNRNFAGLALIGLVGVLLVLSTRAAWYASYRNGDIPLEMMVYTQTSPHIVELLRHLERIEETSGRHLDTTITIDETSGFTWPWAWYLRNYNSVEYRTYENAFKQKEAPDSLVLLVHSRNALDVDPLISDKYSGGIRIRHRWWFPEVYRDLTVRKLFRAMVDPGAWRRVKDYFLHRKLGTHLGSEDAYVYFDKGISSIFSPTK